ncbi:gluconolactonase [Streptomyces zhaozhouensis]|uniref:Gluconolactonase n=1 Tax=Streptomyces zhaozhouensis TaxID=1300267 RepID=A0A286DU73_9ACTN|nr:SMP-30/gluconolactonase/LRE family protein [Streptomyces zhaozhouensis]SOD62215.1 gluconolactonase [Streptomyces zhaozhouensis]
MPRFPLPRLAALTAVATLALTGCGTEPADGPAPADGRAHHGGTGAATVEAERFLRLTETHPETGMTLLEGPTFDAEGRLLVVDVTAPAGAPKVLRVDLQARTSERLLTDDRGAYTSAQFSPHDGRLYLSDFAHGEIVSAEPDGSDPRVFFAGEVDGAPMHPDDIAFDPDGHLYLSDSRGLAEGESVGRVVRVDREGREATVLADGLAAPNGISFDADFRGLWVSELTENRVSYLQWEAEGGVAASHTALRVDGGLAQTDSIAVDADGNLYQGLHGRPAVLVYDRYGRHLATIEIPAGDEGLTSATNLAITPGGTTAYLTVSGPAGGYLYTFEALAEGTRQSNGG